MKRKTRLFNLLLCLTLSFTLIISSFIKGVANDKVNRAFTINNTEECSSISNEFLGILVNNSTGSFNSGCNITEKQYNISYIWPSSPWSSFTTIRIDNANFIFGETYDNLNGKIISPPRNISNVENATTWKLGNIEVTQTLKITDNTLTGRKDTGMYKYTIKNNDTVPHSLGARIMIDTCLNDNDGNPFNVPGVGAIVNEKDFTGEAVPQYWQGFDQLGSSIMAQGILYGSGITKPNRFAICEWNNLDDKSEIWNYTVDPEKRLYDSAVAMWWDTIEIGPGQTREISTLYGLGTMSGNADLSITGPVELEIENKDWSPNPFSVMAYAANNTTSELKNVNLKINLPEGLSLPNGESAVKTIPSIAVGQTIQVSWNVMANTAGSFTYSVSSEELNASASRTINVPYIDKFAPNTSISFDSQPNSNGWHNKDVKITLNAVDDANGSGVKEICYKIGENEIVTQGASATLNVTNQGTTKIYYWSVDNMGNKEEVKEAVIKLDKTNPNITIVSPENKTYTSDVVLNFNGNDDLSGIDKVSASLDGKPVNNGDKIDISTNAGKHNLIVTAKDKAGNITTKNIEFEIKAETPKIEATKVTLNKHEITIYVGESFNLEATILPSNATDKTIKWSSNNESKAIVDQNGKVTGVRAGEAIITAATSDGKCFDTCKVIVKNKEGSLPVTGTNIYWLIPLGILSLIIGTSLLFKRKLSNCK